MKKNKNSNFRVVQYDLVDKMKQQNLERLKMNFEATKGTRFFRNFKANSKRISHNNDSTSIQNNTTNYSSKLMQQNSRDISQKQSHKLMSNKEFSTGRRSLGKHFEIQTNKNVPQLDLQAIDKFEHKFNEFKKEQLNKKLNKAKDLPQQRFIQAINSQLITTKNYNQGDSFEEEQEYQTRTTHQNKYQNVQDLQYKLEKNKNRQFKKNKSKILQQRSLKIDSEIANDQCSEIIFESNNENLTYEDFQNIDKMIRQMSVYWFELKQIVDLSSNEENKLLNSKLNQIYQIQQKIVKILLKSDLNNHSRDSKLFYTLLKQKIGYFYEILELPKPKTLNMSQEKILSYFEQIYHKVQQNQLKHNQDSLNQKDFNNLCSGQSRASFNQQLEQLIKENNEKDEKIMFLIQQNQQIEIQFMDQKNQNNQILSQLLDMQREKNNEFNHEKEVDYLNQQLRKMKKKLKDNYSQQNQQMKQKNQKIQDLEEENDQLKNQLEYLYIQNQKMQSLNEMQKNLNNEQIVSRLSLSQISVDQSLLTDKNQSIASYHIQQKIREQNQRFLQAQLQSQNSNMLKSQSHNQQQNFSHNQTKTNNQQKNREQDNQDKIEQIMSQFKELKKLNEDLALENKSLKKQIQETSRIKDDQDDEQYSNQQFEQYENNFRISFQKQPENLNGNKIFENTSQTQQNQNQQNQQNLRQIQSEKNNIDNLRQSHRFNTQKNPFQENIFQEETGSEEIEEIEVVETESQYIDPEPISKIEEEASSFYSNYQFEKESEKNYNSVLSDTAKQLIQFFNNFKKQINSLRLKVLKMQFFYLIFISLIIFKKNFRQNSY